MTCCTTRKNAIYFSRSFRYEPPGHQWGNVVVNYSLSRLEPYVAAGNFDVIFFSNNEEKSDELRRRYPWLIIEHFDLIEYPEPHVMDRTMHKWYNLLKLGGYEKMLYLDNDTYMNDDPSKVFDAYNDDYARGLFHSRIDWTQSERWFENEGVRRVPYNGMLFYPLCENSVTPLKSFNHMETINSGAMLFSKKHYEIAKNVLIKELESVAKLFNEEVEDLLVRGIVERGTYNMDMFDSQSDEIIGKAAFENLGIQWKCFQPQHITINTERQITDSIIVHFINSTKNINTIVPSEFILEYLGEAQ